METKDKRVKREIANSNERRRMQSINAGFQKLKRLLPVNDGEKLSKASILQHASEFIQQIEREKLILYEQNTLLRGILMEIRGGTDVSTALHTIDLDALPTIPINTHSHASNSNDDNNIDPNNNDDCIRGTSSSNSSSASNTITNTTNINNSNATTTATTTATTPTNPTPTTNINNTVRSRNAHRNNSNNNFQETPNQSITGPKNGVAKAAIALPLEVPCYTRLDLLIHAASSDLSNH